MAFDMNSQDSQPLTLDEVANLVANELDADVIHYNGSIERHADKWLIDECIRRRKRPNVFVLLVTQGGDADPAYRIARCLQSKYDKFYIFVSGYCKSAGTLIALGAHELIMSDHGELGPLDVQLSKKDELWETQSGLTVMDTLAALQDNAFNAFEKFFIGPSGEKPGYYYTENGRANRHRDYFWSIFGTLRPSGPVTYRRSRKGNVNRRALWTTPS